MKKIFALLFIMTIASFSASAQSLQLQTGTGTVIPNGGTISRMAVLYDTTQDVQTEIVAKNISASEISFKVKKTPKIVVSPQKSYFCFAGGCFSDTTTISPTVATVAAGGSDNSFSGHISPNHGKGSALVYYKFYNTRNPNDTASVYIQYEIWPAGINELADSPAALGNAYPNPAGKTLNVDYTINSKGSARLVIQNLLGVKVKEEMLAGMNGKAQIDVSDLPEGIYMYSLEIEGKDISAKKLLVRH